MKRLLKKILRAVYRRAEFVRRPIRNELETTVRRCFSDSYEEVRFSMDELVAEVHRLQRRVDELTAEVADLRSDDRAAA